MAENLELDTEKLTHMKQKLLEGVSGAAPMAEAFAEVVKTGEEVFGPHMDAISKGTAHLPGFCVFDDTGYDLELAKRSVGKGWHGILDRLWAVKPPEARVEQVKEKFGGLRVYASGSEAFFKSIDEAESESYRTCEECGKPGICRPHGWRLTLCDECDIKMHSERGWPGDRPGGAACKFREDDEDV